MYICSPPRNQLPSSSAAYMITQEVVQAFEDSERVHFKPLWLASKNYEEQILLELFCFGDYKDKTEEMQLPLWTNRMEQKLQILTLLGLCERQRELGYDDLMNNCGIEHDGDLEQRLIDLHKLVQLEIDSVSRRITVKQCLDSRDVYNNERPLQLLHQAKRSKQEVLKQLKRWKYKLQRDLICE
ncbi:Csn9p Ecym_4189 [Eremothecium cymbalariae DBVPG|uniref:Uncharacterized protein n=1 Tax=Eremothecium cymbalariae (strain CBS 270.75 / DBVPG 7215 / KCTC 17166 / NRRL Y-17582) TaxID=931890 RepID=G8JTB2_ERECY|nr:hypothetical protein Ecym_4189 [Eremothecium cymbalariae DBVPG\